jgi:hypothetical protein
MIAPLHAKRKVSVTVAGNTKEDVEWSNMRVSQKRGRRETKRDSLKI